MNKLHPSGPSTCFPAAWATACARGLARGDVVNGEPNCGNVAAVDVVDGVVANCEVSASAPAPKTVIINKS